MKGKDVFYGEVEFWNGNSYGFIRPDRGGDDIFFHVSELPEAQEIYRGARVTFDIDRPKTPPSDETRLIAVTLQN